MLRCIAWSGLTVTAFLASALAAEPSRLTTDNNKKNLPSPGRIEVDYTSNDAWKVGVSANNPEGVYTVGDEVFIKVTSDRPGYLYVFHVDAAGNINCLFPNMYQPDNAIPAEQAVTIPDPGNQKFRIRASPPAGKELVKAIVTKEPLREVDAKEFTRRAVAPVTRKRFVRLATEVMGGDPTKVDVQDTAKEPASAPPSGQKPPPPKPDVSIQKQKLEKEKPEVYQQKKKEWATGQLELTVVEGRSKPPQVPNKPSQGSKKPAD